MSCPRPDLGERLVELVGARAQPAPDVEEHVASCLPCASELASLREVHETLDALKPAPPSDAVLERARLAGLGRGAAGAQWRLWAAGVVGLAASAGFLVAAGVRADLAHQALGLLALPVLVVACALGLRAAARSKPLDLPFLAVLALGLGLSLAVPPGDAAPPTTCFALILGLTLAPLGVALSALAAAPRSTAAGAAAGAATCLLGLAALRAHCPASTVAHFAFAHLPSLPVAALLGALGARLVRRYAR